MITGTVTSAREAILHLVVIGEDGQTYEVESVIDTGFNGWLTLPHQIIETLGLTWRRASQAILADGSQILTNTYDAIVVWDGERMTIPVDEAEADPLLGMSLMYGYELNMPILDGATFSLHQITS